MGTVICVQIRRGDWAVGIVAPVALMIKASDIIVPLFGYFIANAPAVEPGLRVGRGNQGDRAMPRVLLTAGNDRFPVKQQRQQERLRPRGSARGGRACHLIRFRAALTLPLTSAISGATGQYFQLSFTLVMIDRSIWSSGCSSTSAAPNSRFRLIVSRKTS